MRSLLQGRDDRQRVLLAEGSELEARLVVLASGTAAQLASRVGPSRQSILSEQSVWFGFDVARCDGRAFPFDSVTYYPDGHDSAVGYLTLFLIGSVMRANLFTFWPVRGDRATAFVRESRAALDRALSGLTRLIGELDVALRRRLQETSRARGSLRWRIHRARVYSTKWLWGGVDSFKLTRRLRGAARRPPAA